MFIEVIVYLRNILPSSWDGRFSLRMLEYGI